AQVELAPVDGVSGPDVSEDASPLAREVGARMAAMAQHLRRHPGLDDFDLLHSQDSITANALATLRDEGRIPGFLRTVHHLDEFEDPSLAAWQRRGVLAASQLLCVSPLWQQLLRDGWGREAEVVPNGVDIQRFNPVPADAARDEVLLRTLGVRHE